MSATTTARPASTRPQGGTSVLRKLVGGLLGIAAVTAATIAVWPASEADKAREDGEALGQAVAALSSAQSTEDVEAAQADIQVALEDTRTHAGDAAADQADKQVDALNRAADGVAGSLTTESEWDYELYQAELDIALNDLYDNATEFRAEGPEVQQAYWEGFEAGLPAQ